MQDQVKVSLVQFSPVWLDRERNARRMVEFVEAEATNHGAQLVVFPELATTGYLTPDLQPDFKRQMLDQSEPIPGPTTLMLSEVARKHRVHIIAGISQRHPRVPYALYNSAAFIGPDGALIGVYQKIHSAIEEKNIFVPGSTVDVYDTSLGKVAINICYDVRFPELARIQALKGAEIIVAIWATYEQPGRAPSDAVKVRCRSRATENFVYFLGCNRTGQELDRVFTGRSIIAAPSGEVITESNTDQEEVIRGTLTDEALRDQRLYLTIFSDRRPELYGSLADVV